MSETEPTFEARLRATLRLPEDASEADILAAAEQAHQCLLEVEAIGEYLATQALPPGIPTVGAAAIMSALCDHHRLRAEGPPGRRRLPNRRRGITQKVRVGGQTLYLRTGEYADGSLGEVFLTMNKQGTFIDAALNALAKVISVALQYGVPLQVIVDGFLHSRFEPAGLVTGDNDIVRTTSALDYLVRRLAIDYLDRGDLANAEPRDTDTEDLAAELEAASEEMLGEGTHEAEPAAEEPEAPASPLTPQQMGYTGNACAECGSMRMTRNGSCEKCMDCGSTTGCS